MKPARHTRPVNTNYELIAYRQAAILRSQDEYIAVLEREWVEREAVLEAFEAMLPVTIDRVREFQAENARLRRALGEPLEDAT